MKRAEFNTRGFDPTAREALRIVSDRERRAKKSAAGRQKRNPQQTPLVDIDERRIGIIVDDAVLAVEMTSHFSPPREVIDRTRLGELHTTRAVDQALNRLNNRAPRERFKPIEQRDDTHTQVRGRLLIQRAALRPRTPLIPTTPEHPSTHPQVNEGVFRSKIIEKLGRINRQLGAHKNNSTSLSETALKELIDSKMALTTLLNRLNNSKQAKTLKK